MVQNGFFLMELQFSYQNLASTLSTPSHMGEFGTSINSNTYLH